MSLLNSEHTQKHCQVGPLGARVHLNVPEDARQGVSPVKRPFALAAVEWPDLNALFRGRIIVEDRIDDANVRVPDKLSVAGFDNIFISSLAPISMTTVEHSRLDMGVAAGWTEPVHMVIQPALVSRKTTAGPWPSFAQGNRSA
ncbi:substrate-binding domain-containing protein [Arthrobacter sp. H-02-3]|uniref:substrate-binding domain-containing protein n=1 Tax=Arthrobacter sp. H-02-3 TaxID=2703675 RepID=UPI0010583614|nr:substrate-binding domain-containing protein [Arthrobacter sp. H-02-3]